MIFVTVGSRPYQFDRLFIEIDDLIDRGIISEPVFAQIGSSSYKPIHFSYARYLDPKTFSKKIFESSLVISHGASGTIVKALEAKKTVIGVTRLEKYGEHIDDHQIQMNQAFESNNLIVGVYDLADLKKAYLTVVNKQVKLAEWSADKEINPVDIVDEFIQANWP